MTTQTLHPAPAERLPRPAARRRALQVALLLGGLAGLGLLCGGQAHAADTPGAAASSAASLHSVLGAAAERPVAGNVHAVQDRVSGAVLTPVAGASRDSREAREKAARPVLDTVRQVTDPAEERTEPAAQLTEPARGLTKPVRGLTETVGGLTEPVHALTEPTHGLTETVGGLTEPVRGLTETVGGLTKPVRGLTKPVRGLTETVGGLTKPVRGLTGQVIGGLVTATPRPLPDGPPALPGVPGLPALPGHHPAPAPAPSTPTAPSAPAEPTAPTTSAEPSAPAAGQPARTSASRHEKPQARTPAAAHAVRVAGPTAYDSTGSGAVHHDGAHRAPLARHTTAPRPAAPAAPGTPPRPDGVLGANASAGDGGSTRHGDLYAAAFGSRVPVLLLPGTLAPGLPAPVADRHRGIPEFPG